MRLDFSTSGMVKEFTSGGVTHITFPVTDRRDIPHVREAISLFNPNRTYTVMVEELKKPRSLNANSYFHKLCDLIAVALRSDKESIKNLMIERYGYADYHVMHKPAADFAIKQGVFRFVVSLGTVTVRNEKGELKEGEHMQCFWHTADLDSQKFSVLLDGTVSEARELGIKTLEDERIKRLAEEWEARYAG